MNEASDVILIWIFPWKCQKSSIPKCHELRVGCHFYLDFSMKMSNKSSIPRCQELGIRCHCYMDFPWKCQKKLDTQMSWIKHPMSFSYGFSMKMWKKSSIPRCHELSIRCYFYMDLSNKKYPRMLSTKMPWIKHPMSCLYSMWWKEKYFTRFHLHDAHVRSGPSWYSQSQNKSPARAKMPPTAKWNEALTAGEVTHQIHNHRKSHGDKE